MENSNPLSKYFRQPAIYVQLPSKGQFYPQNAVEIPENQELPVYPMTAMDEITYRTADALFNGNAIVDVIKSCVPNIKEPWQMPTTDLDTILIAIRIATYGHELEFTSACPSCSEENQFAIDLRGVLDNLKSPDYEKTVELGDLTVYFKPINYKQQNTNALVQFEDQKIMETLPIAEMDEAEKLDMLNATFVKLGSASMRLLAQSIRCVKVDQDLVANEDHILEFINNCDKKIYTAIRDHIVNVREEATIKPLKVQCTSCDHVYETPFTLDVSNFFASDS